MMVQKLVNLAANGGGGKPVTQSAPLPPPQDLAAATFRGWGELTSAWIKAATRWWFTIVEWAVDECAYTGVNQTTAYADVDATAPLVGRFYRVDDPARTLIADTCVTIGQTTDAALASGSPPSAANPVPSARRPPPAAPSCWWSRSVPGPASHPAGTEARWSTRPPASRGRVALRVRRHGHPMTDSRYEARVQDLISDAEEHAARGDWDAVRDLARAALSLAPSNDAAQRLLAEADAADPAPGERRQLTVMFCDVVGSTVMGLQRDPEIVREVLRRYQGACDAVIRQYGGHVATYVGDGVLAYFGHPVAHEDDPHRAVRAGLDILQALEPVTAEARERYDLDLNIRAAVHTGLVVRAEMGSPSSPDRDAIVGDTPNLAARLQDHAPPGTLLVSQATYQLVRGWFLMAPAGS